jgi:hypothetical protein
VDEKFLAGSQSGQTEPYTQVHFCNCLAPPEMRDLKRLPGNDHPIDEISDAFRWPRGKLDGPACGIRCDRIPSPPISDPLLPLFSLNRAFKICSARKRESTP